MTALAELLHRLRGDLVEEATPLPGQSRMYGRPHAHPRARYEPRFSVTGERLPGSVYVRPDCPRPIAGRCECPPDGTWRPSVGVIRADSMASQLVAVPAIRLPRGQWPAERIFVHSVYEKGPDGLWRCRWPVRRALEVLRGVSVRRWSIAIRLLRGDELRLVWGSHGPPPDPAGEAFRLMRQIERWAAEERETEWEVRPRQWWDAPRDPNARAIQKSDAQANAEHELSVEVPLRPVDTAATIAHDAEAELLPRPASGPGPRPEQPSGQSGARPLSGIPFAKSPEERACA